MDGDEIEYGLVCPFLTDDPVYAHGFELGQLSMRMKTENPIEGYFHTANQEQITLLANRLGWMIVEMEPWEEHPDQWFWLEMTNDSACQETQG